MNIICNDCLSGFLYKSLNIQFNNPFFWSRIYLNDFIHLIDGIDNLDLYDFELKLNKDYANSFNLKEIDRLSPVIYLQGIRVFFNHYKYDPSARTPRIEIPDVYYYRNYEYAISKYLKRLDRFNKKDIQVIFHWNDLQNDAVEQDIYKLIETCIAHNYKLIIVSNKVIKTTHPLILTIYDSDVVNKPVEQGAEEHKLKILQHFQ